MNKKLIIALSIIVGVIFLGLFLSIKFIPVKVESKPIFSFLNEETLNVDDIESIKYVRYTEGGDNEVIYTSKKDIESLYNSVKNISIGKETNRACEDNTTVYVFNLKDETKLTIEIECDWIVVNNKRYEIVKN